MRNQNRNIKLECEKEWNLLFMSISAFLHTMLEKRRPIPLIEVMANMIFCLPSTFVFCTRRMCWKSSFATSDCKIEQTNQYPEKNISQKSHGDNFTETNHWCGLGFPEPSKLWWRNLQNPETNHNLYEP